MNHFEKGNTCKPLTETIRRLAWVLPCLLLSCAGPQIQVKDHTLCTVAGIFQGGMDCATDESGKVSELTFPQMIDFLEPQAERPDPNHPGQKLPARAGAVCEPDLDFTDLKTALEQACTELKDRCTTAIKDALAKASAAQKAIHASAKKKGLP